MTLIPELDYKQTKENARSILKKCRSWQRMSGISVHLESPIITDMPRNNSNTNSVERKMIKKFGLVSKHHIDTSKESREEIQAVVSALKSLSDVSRDILYYSYLVVNPCGTVKLSRIIRIYKEDELGKVQEITYSVKNIEKLKSLALIEFAEAYRGGKLLAFKK